LPSFPAAHRLRHKREFDRVYREGRRQSDNFFLVLAVPNSLSHPRLGLSVSAKTAGNAVGRNRIKRLIRESFRLCSTSLPKLDIVVNTRVSAREAPNPVLARSLQQLWDKLTRYA
jgi:ribonuclease P protein component